MRNEIETKHLLFVEDPSLTPIDVKGDKNYKYTIINKHNKSWLGDIFFDTKWKKHVWSIEDPAIFDKDCLKDIASVLNDLDDK